MHPILPVIYPDRFMHSNKQEVEALRRNVLTLRKKITHLKAGLAKFINFNGLATSIEVSLGQVLHFFVG